jgi:lipoate-protein ligase A
MDPVAWQVEWHRGDAAAFHARPVPGDLAPSVWVFEVDRPALVLGSSQPDDHVDLERARAAGIDVVRRRSGGGAVLLVPDEVVWVDVIVPAVSPVWDADVVRSAWWLGEVWARALSEVLPPTTASRLSVHRGRSVPSEWSRHVCFAGVGPGEVLDGRSKLVGVSQRRTRLHARFQCALHRRWQPELIAALLRAPGPRASDLFDVVATVDVDVDDLVGALVDRLGWAHRELGTPATSVEGAEAAADANSQGVQPASHP